MNSLRNESGSVLVFVTLMVVILMALVGMGLDTGFLTLSRSMGQRAVDMAALAGAAGLAKGDAAAIQSNIQQVMVNETANDYIGRTNNVIDPTINGKNVTLLTYDFTTKTITGTTTDIKAANAIRVALETTNPYTTASSNTAISTPAFLTPLMNLFGGGTDVEGANEVNVSAVAVIEAQAGLPIAINGCDPAWESENAVPIIWNQSPDPANNSGWTTYLDNSVSTPNVIELIHKIASCQGIQPVSVGTPICLNNGQQNPDLRELEILIGTNPDSTPKCYVTPVVPSTGNFTGCDNPIQQWAQICPLAVCGPGVNGTVNQELCTEPGSVGKYLYATVKNCNVADPNVPGVSSCYSLRLARETQVGM